MLITLPPMLTGQFSGVIGAEIEERGSAHFDALFDGDVDVGAAEVLIFGEIGGETAIRTTCGRIFGDAETFGKNANMELTIWIDSFGAKHQNRLSW